MSEKTHELPLEIRDETEALISKLNAIDWDVLDSRYDAKVMGNWHVDLGRDGLRLRLVKDRSQFFVTGVSVEQLEAAGLTRVFDDFSKFQQAVLSWATHRLCV